jgi:NitT/TauT family transport system substrate-binding protein
MPTRRNLLLGLGALALAQANSGCGARRPLSIGAHVWPGYEPMFLGRDSGWLPSGISLEETSSATDSLARLHAGQIDGAALTLDEVLIARSGGVALTTLLVFNVSVGADMVLAKPEITCVTQLRGHRIGVETTALGALMLVKLLDFAGLDESEVTVVHTPIERQEAALATGSIDAVITYYPNATRLLDKGYRRLFDSRQTPDTIFDVLAVRSELLKEHQAALRGLIVAHFRALELKHRNPQTAAFRMARRLGVTGQQVPDAFSGLSLPGIDANRTLLGPTGSVLLTAERLSGFMAERGLLKQSDTLDGLVSADFLPRRTSTL